MVQTMPVLRDTAGSESMSSRHMCSMKVSAIAAWSCCVWMMEELISFVFDMAGSDCWRSPVKTQDTSTLVQTTNGQTEKLALRQGLWKRSQEPVNTGVTTTVWLNAFPHIPAGV